MRAAHVRPPRPVSRGLRRQCKRTSNSIPWHAWLCTGLLSSAAPDQWVWCAVSQSACRHQAHGTGVPCEVHAPRRAHGAAVHHMLQEHELHCGHAVYFRAAVRQLPHGHPHDSSGHGLCCEDTLHCFCLPCERIPSSVHWHSSSSSWHVCPRSKTEAPDDPHMACGPWHCLVVPWGWPCGSCLTAARK